MGVATRLVALLGLLTVAAAAADREPRNPSLAEFLYNVVFPFRDEAPPCDTAWDLMMKENVPTRTDFPPGAASP